MPRLAVVLDTNAYVAIGDEAFESLRDHERNHSVVARANYYVATELLAHLADEADPAFRRSCSALRRLGKHCGRWNGHATIIDFMQLPDAQIARILFGRTLAAESDAHSNAYATVIGRLIDDPAVDVITSFRASLIELRYQVQRGEEEFAEKFWHTVVLTLNPDAGDWHDVTRSGRRRALLDAIDSGQGLELIAGTIVDRAANRAGLTMDGLARAKAVEAALVAFPTAVHHHNLLVRELIANGPDMSLPHRANSLWDHEITFSTGRGATVNGVPLVLVTSDPLILRAAEAAGTQGNVWSLVEYQERLANRDEEIDRGLETRSN